MAKQYSYWTQEEINLILDNYQTKDINWLTKQLSRHTKMSIGRKIANMKLSKPQSRKCNIQPLLEETPEAYYWLGFMMADAHISNVVITVTYNSKDQEHIDKLKKFLNSENISFDVKGSDCSRVNFGDRKLLPILTEKFNIHTNKTKNPCNISNIKDDLFFSLIIGFIDGDGSIYKKELKTCSSYHLYVVGDKTWINNFKLIFNFIHEYIDEKSTNQQPYLREQITSLPQSKDIKRSYILSNFYITNRKVIQKMKQKILELKIPYMERKWDKVTL